MTTKEQQAVDFWCGLGHKPGDGCDPEAPYGARPKPWRIVHTPQEEENAPVSPRWRKDLNDDK